MPLPVGLSDHDATVKFFDNEAIAKRLDIMEKLQRHKTIFAIYVKTRKNGGLPVSGKIIPSSSFPIKDFKKIMLEEKFNSRKLLESIWCRKWYYFSTKQSLGNDCFLVAKRESKQAPDGHYKNLWLFYLTTGVINGNVPVMLAKLYSEKPYMLRKPQNKILGQFRVAPSY